MKNATTKKLFAYITTVILMFSFATGHAQGNGNGNGNNGPCKGNKVLCSGKNGGFYCAKPGECSRLANEQSNLELLSIDIFPNPFSITTAISFSLSQSENVSIKIYDLHGKLIRTLANEVMSAGKHELMWDVRDGNGNAVCAGVYFLQLSTEENSETLQLNMLK